MPAHFRCGDFSLNLLMQVDGRLDKDKQAMIDEIKKFLDLDPLQQQAFSLIQRSYPVMLPLDAVEDPHVMEKTKKEIQRLEESSPDGFNKTIRALMVRQLPPPPSDSWPE
jgi:hypothetical protein